MLCKRLLCGDRPCDGVARAGERIEEGVSLRVDLRAAVLPERVADEAAVVADDVAVSVAEALEQLGRALDVGEEESDCSSDCSIDWCTRRSIRRASSSGESSCGYVFSAGKSCGASARLS